MDNKVLMDRCDKIHELKDFLKIRDELAADGLTLVMTNGCFDLLHVGHTRSLFHARTLGDRLLVAINSDRAVQELKGPERPLTPERERAELLAACECVDFVVVFDSNDAKQLIRAVRPDIHAKGTDYTVETVPERSVVEDCGGVVAIVGDPKLHATRELVSRLSGH